VGVGAGLYMYVVVVQKFTFAMSSPDEFLLLLRQRLLRVCVVFLSDFVTTYNYCKLRAILVSYKS